MKDLIEVYSITEEEPRLRKKEELLNYYKNLEDTPDVILYDLEEDSLISLLEEIQIMPFLNPYKVIILTNPDFLYGHKYDEKVLNQFLKYLSNPVDYSKLIIILENFDKVIEPFKSKLKVNAKIEIIKKLSKEEFKPYAENLIREKGYSISNEALDELILRTSYNQTLLNNEIEKILIYKDNDYDITYDDINLLITRPLEDNVFNLINAIIDNKRNEAYMLYKDLMVLNQDETKIISLLVGKYNELYCTKNLADAGYSQQDIATIMNVSPGRAYYMIKNSNKASKEFFKNAINRLIDYDYKIKSGRIDKTFALEEFILT
jgi:DNA polymerase-3 subunit delta